MAGKWQLGDYLTSAGGKWPGGVLIKSSKEIIGNRKDLQMLF